MTVVRAASCSFFLTPGASPLSLSSFVYSIPSPSLTLLLCIPTCCSLFLPLSLVIPLPQSILSFLSPERLPVCYWPGVAAPHLHFREKKWEEVDRITEIERERVK